MRKASCNLLARLLVVVCATGEEVDDGSSSSSCCRRSLAPRDGREFIPPPPSAMVVRLPPPLNHLPLLRSSQKRSLSLSCVLVSNTFILKWGGQDDGKSNVSQSKTVHNRKMVRVRFQCIRRWVGFFVRVRWKSNVSRKTIRQTRRSGGKGGETREGWAIRMEPCAGGGKGFDGLSTLRNGDGGAEEDRGGHGGGARRPAAHLEAYLKDTSSLKPVGKRKRRKKNRSSTKGNLTIVDAEEGTAIPVATMDSGYGDEDVNDELGPVVVNAEEVERDEALRKRRTIARSNQRWQTVTTAAASTPSAVPAGGSRSRSPPPRYRYRVGWKA